jgi:hypothetical protein
MLNAPLKVIPETPRAENNGRLSIINKHNMIQFVFIFLN